jgi:hypothetical protein
MRDAISEIVGQGKFGDGKSAQVYRPLRPLLCSTCGAEIAEDTLFTRRGVKGFGMNIMPQCHKCAPFALLDKKEKKEKSALLQALLREQSPGSAERERASEDSSQEASAQEDKKRIAEEVRQRLAPALKRGRGKFK